MLISKISKKNIDEAFVHLKAVLSSERFLKKEGLGNEVPFFICPHDPEISSEAAKIQKHLIKHLELNKVQVQSIDLYDLSVQLMKDRGIWDQILEMESSTTKEELFELFQGVLDPETHLIPAIADILDNNSYDILFLSGVGEIYPYIRSHTVLNNLQSTAKEKPTVMFFPGSYIQSPEMGASLNLFNKPQDDKYYRAFNIFHYEV